MQLPRPLFFLALLLPCALHAQPAASLPAGGGLDARKVVETRYGAAGLPEQPKAALAKAAPAKAAAAAPESARREASARIEGSLATLVIENTAGGQAGESVPVTFGQVFAPGAVARGKTVQGKTPDGKGVPLQVDAKATHPDGSLRHAVISALLPRPATGKPLVLALSPADRAGAGPAASAGPEAPEVAVTFSAVIDGKRYTASPGRARPAQRGTRWLDGPVATEWHVAAPLRGADGDEHPHLVARFALRAYPGAKRTRIDITIENNWAFEPGPSNFTYDADIAIGGASVYAKPGLTHFHHARWRKLFWTGGDPGVDVSHVVEDLVATRAVPHYDPTLQVADKALAKLDALWQGPRTEPMATGLVVRAMGTTGGRPDIGLLPAWTAMYVASADLRAKRVMLGTADLAGSFPAHYRDKRTGLPVSLSDYPYMTLLGRSSHSVNPATGKNEGFPACAANGACSTPNRHDVAHQPSLVYVPYLVTGDYYYLEELQFWAMHNAFASNPHYRENRKGLLKSYQVRGQAWALRTLAHAAYITPDAHPLKQEFMRLLDTNLDWYNARYTSNPQANRLGFVEENYAIVYMEKTGLAPWQDDFFTSAVGHALELGFTKARPLLAWKATFPVQRMTGAGTCWIAGSQYSLKVRDSATSPLYATIAQVYRASTAPEVAGLPCAGPEMATALKLKPGEMPGYSTSATGFPSNMQPALAYAAGAAGEAGRAAWERFMARSVKPDYGMGPQFAIVPR